MSTGTFTIPSIYTAIDRSTNVLRKMEGAQNSYTRSVQNTGKQMNAGEAFLSRQVKWFKKLTPVIRETTAGFLGYLQAAAIAGLILSTINFSYKQIVDYQDALANFRVIVSDLSNKEFAVYQKQIEEVANKTKKSTVEVAKSFENIAGLNAKFAETAEGLGLVSSASIILSKAAKMELGSAAESLVGIMNQFSLGAEQADRAINVLAAGQAVGASSITQSAEAYKNFGAVANKANITLEQSQALIQTLAGKQIMGAEAGTALRGVVLKLQKAGAGYASGQFKIDDALSQVTANMAKLKTAKERDALMTKIFGAENITAATILLSNIPAYQQFTKGVTGTTEAHKAAEIQSQGLSTKVEELKNKWTNLITTNDKVNEGAGKLSTILGWVTDHMDTLLNVGIKLVGFFIAWKAIIWLTQAALFAYNVVLGVTMALQGKSAFTVMGNTVAYTAFRVAVMAAQAAQWLLNAALTANPIGLIIVAIIALIAVVAVVIKYWDKWGKYVNLLLGPLGIVIELIQSFRRNWDNIKEAFKKDGILGAIKAIGVAILDSVLSPLQRVLEIASKLPGKLGELAKSGAQNIQDFRNRIGAAPESTDTPPPAKALPAINTKQAQAKAMASAMSFEQSSQLDITLKGATNQAKVTRNTGGIPIKTTPSLYSSNV